MGWYAKPDADSGSLFFRVLDDVLQGVFLSFGPIR